VLLVSHGTVDRVEDLEAFAKNIRHGRPPPPELVAELRRRYEAIGGSPLNSVSAQLTGWLATRLGVRALWANRFWTPDIASQLQQLEDWGVQRVVVVPLAQHSAHVYEADVRKAATGRPGLELVFAANWGRHEKLSAAFAKRILAALEGLDRARTTVVMTAHSLPKSVVERGDPYEREVRASAEAIAKAVAPDLRWTLAFQSQGMSDVPGGWLGPDLPTTIAEVAARGDAAVVFAPVGFLADHVEILYDLDIEAAAMVQAKGMSYARARSLNADDDFVDVLVDVARPLLGNG
jgi:ferrochelatase